MENQLTVRNVGNRLTTALLIIYLIILSWILLLKLGVHFYYMEERRVNLYPFKQLILNGKIDAVELALNAVVFVPLGVYAGILFERWTFGTKLLTIFLVSLIIEGLQYVLKVGALDTTDIFMNTFGGMVGFIIFKAIENLFDNRIRTRNSIITIASIGTAVMILLLLLLKMDMLPVMYK